MTILSLATRGHVCPNRRQICPAYRHNCRPRIARREPERSPMPRIPVTLLVCTHRPRRLRRERRTNSRRMRVTPQRRRRWTTVDAMARRRCRVERHFSRLCCRWRQADSRKRNPASPTSTITTSRSRWRATSSAPASNARATSAKTTPR